MAQGVITRKEKSAAAQKKVAPVRRAKKSKTTSVVVLVLYGSTALRRRKSAETFAKSLHVDLFRVDLSAVVTQYIGETETNLNAVFDKAQASGSILFFDEADALFGSRGTVKDSHDRYENAETAYFLQRIEHHDGIVILTTNGKQRIERAFSSQPTVAVIVGTAENGRTKKVKKP